MAEDTSVDETVASKPVMCSFFDTPEGRKLAYHKLDGASPGVVYVHGLCSDMNGLKAIALEDYCRSRGRAYFRFELSGHGQSSETFTDCNISTWLEDMSAVLDSLTEGPQVLVGSSIGAWLMFLYTMRNPDKVHGLIGVASAPDYTERLWKGLDKDTQQAVKRSGVYKLQSSYDNEPMSITMQLFQDGEKHNILDMPGIEYIKVPTWLLHGEQDEVVPVSTVLKIMQRLQSPVSLRTVEDGDHQLSRPQDLKLILEAITELLNPEECVKSAEQED